jgi:hypothetical protein
MPNSLAFSCYSCNVVTNGHSVKGKEAQGQ